MASDNEAINQLIKRILFQSHITMIPKGLKTCNQAISFSFEQHSCPTPHLFAWSPCSPSSCSSFYVCADNVRQMKVSSSESLRTLEGNCTRQVANEKLKTIIIIYLMWVLLIIFWIFNYIFTWFKKYTRVYSENMQR